jgi:hypothetical protein
MASANRRTPRVQRGGDAAVGMPSGTAQHHEKVADGEARRGGAPIWWKKWCNENGAAGRHSGDLLEIGEVGRLKWKKEEIHSSTGLARSVLRRSRRPRSPPCVGFPLDAPNETLCGAGPKSDIRGATEVDFQRRRPDAAFVVWGWEGGGREWRCRNRLICCRVSSASPLL